MIQILALNNSDWVSMGWGLMAMKGNTTIPNALQMHLSAERVRHPSNECPEWYKQSDGNP